MSTYTNENNCERSDEKLTLLFASIFKKHQRSVYQLAYRVTKSSQQANDIVQEVFLKLWEHRRSIAEIDNMDAWLSRVVRNKLTDFLRKAAADDRLRASLWRKVQHVQNDAAQPLEVKESDMLMHEAVEQLPDQRKIVYRLNRETGMSYQEIADQLSISKHTVKNQLYLAIRFLQKRLSI
jgi:RNA polymerase sigma-70 factor (ECF subfamily)